MNEDADWDTSYGCKCGHGRVAHDDMGYGKCLSNLVKNCPCTLYKPINVSEHAE